MDWEETFRNTCDQYNKWINRLVVTNNFIKNQFHLSIDFLREFRQFVEWNKIFPLLDKNIRKEFREDYLNYGKRTHK